MAQIRDERVRQATVGVGILIGLATLICGLLLGWRFVPGIVGEWIGTMVGIMSTPFFLEGSFMILGLVIVISLNVWHRHKEGDELVYLEQVTGPDVPTDLPDQAKWAIYREEPLPTTRPTALECAEGSFAIGDHAATADWISKMGEHELKEPATLDLRLRLARATGRELLAKELETEIRNLSILKE